MSEGEKNAGISEDGLRLRAKHAGRQKKREICRDNCLAVPAERGPHGELPEPASVRPLSLAWISDELLAKTRRVWSKAYGRPVSTEEAVEILMNIKHMAEALLKAKRGGDMK